MLLKINNLNGLTLILKSEFCYEIHRHMFLLGSGSDSGTAVPQWLRCCATNRKVAGSILDGVIGIFR